VRRAFAALALVLGAACTSAPNPDEPIVIEEVDNCGAIVDAGIRLVLQFAEELERVPLDVASGDAEPTARLRELRQTGRALDERAAGFECDPAELNVKIAEGLPDLGSTNPAVELLYEQVAGGVIGSLPEPVSTTTSPPDETTSR
jgi:hypothetical protein